VFAAAQRGFPGAQVQLTQAHFAVAMETLLFEERRRILLCPHRHGYYNAEAKPPHDCGSSYH
jgi:hypothetical protein